MAGHAFKSTPGTNLASFVPTADMKRLISMNPEMIAAPPRSQAVQYKIDQTRSGKPIEVVGHPQIAMQDWDWPNEGHIAKGAITISNLGDVQENLSKFIQENPGELWKMYITPGGIRAFDLANRRPARESADFLQSRLNSDPYYAQFSAGRDVWNSRISAKPGRVDDFVALPIGTMGNGVPDPVNMDYVRRFHDIPIIENRIVNNQLSIPESAFKLIERQADSLSPGDRAGIDPLLSRLYAKGFL